MTSGHVGPKLGKAQRAAPPGVPFFDVSPFGQEGDWSALTYTGKGRFSSVYLHSDLIIFHSQEYAENMRIHINQVAPEEMRRNAVGKVVALGSPKFDAVLHASREDYPLPSAWQQRINGKKVLLYSTALKALLEETEQFITRLVAELKFFRKQEDVVLWWRPHPLSAATLFGMRPNLLQKYEQIVTQYQREGWGIYDETTLLHRAIAWSDGCYTDESSLLFLYLATGKPFVCRTFYQLKHQVSEPSQDFTPILDRQIANMQAARGANIYHENMAIWWHCFADRDIYGETQYDNFLARFLHFVLYEDQYPQAKLYRKLKRKMFEESVVNPDGTAGQKIYEFVKQKVWE